MTPVIQAFHLLVLALAGWRNRQQQAVIDYLIAENRVLKDQLEDLVQGVGSRLLKALAMLGVANDPIHCREF